MIPQLQAFCEFRLILKRVELSNRSFGGFWRGSSSWIRHRRCGFNIVQDNSEVKRKLEEAHKGRFDSGVDSLGNIFTSRYIATELATDIVVNVGDVIFYLHKFPLLSRSARLQKLVAVMKEENNDEIFIHDITGGLAAFEICAKFYYGMMVTLNAYNVVATRCALEYLEMYKIVEKGNLITRSKFSLIQASFGVGKTRSSFFKLQSLFFHGLRN
ncbi:hypothetical protein TEA_029415 [Camellia sinensis var. sinensis]|uniref:BTB domain-containing protein n=1 Tax=Camellia sinensis var. sinensis TaxID=542762 RepID=A0A4S4DKH2_CAMSN|nr:hypothetical protein TEA_029415 [Camellia sinensis var. sinensis]